MATARALRYYEEHRRLQAATALAVRREWGRMGDDLEASWRSGVGGRIVAVVAAAQLGAARAASRYVTDVLGEPDLRVEPRAFAGAASTVDQMMYGALGSVLYGAVVRARSADANSLRERLEAGGLWLDQAVHTQVGDASKEATTTQMAAWQQVGYTRMAVAPCCKRCAVLDGKWFARNEGFERHPQCDCIHVPSREVPEDWRGIDLDDIKDLTKAERAAMEAGASWSQVINASRKGAVSPDRMWTIESTSRRSWSSHARRQIAKARGELLEEAAGTAGPGRFTRRATPRPTPYAIVKYAKDHDDMVRLLARYGYFSADSAELLRLAGVG